MALCSCKEKCIMHRSARRAPVIDFASSARNRTLIHLLYRWIVCDSRSRFDDLEVGRSSSPDHSGTDCAWVQSTQRCGMIQTTRLVHHMFIKHRCDLDRCAIVHLPHRSNHRTEANKLHRRGSPRPDSAHLLQSYGTQRDTQIRGYLNRTR